MTFRARPVVKRTDRAGRSPRRSLLLNLGFGLVIVVALLILAAAAAASYYGDHLASIASVNGHDISKDQRSEEHTSELQSQSNLVCRLLLEKKKKQDKIMTLTNSITLSNAGILSQTYYPSHLDHLPWWSLVAGSPLYPVTLHLESWLLEHYG